MEQPQYPPPYPPAEVMPEYTQGPPPMVVTTEPTMVDPKPEPVYKDYLAWSVMNMICCCPPLGKVALTYSIQTRNALRHQDFQVASINSRSALIWNVAALILGLLINAAWIAYVIYYFVLRGRRYTYNG